ncbi:MAG: lytic transglycosylase domain-containing protein, partial [Muribaculaceae bacterium]|nr:lytic transglycosylase domain-containing protein [Muribaculaceae bacterium]
MKKRLFLFLIAAASLTAGYAKTDKKPNVLDLKTSITDPAIVYPESFEADTQKLLESWFIKNYTASDNRYATEPDVEVSDEEMVKRLSSLPTVIEMPYNQIVRSYIDRYTKKSRAQIAAILGLSLYYMPIFEQALEEQGLHLELKYLPVIESGLNPNAVSRHGATGLWQFMLGTAKGLGLEVNSLVDERRDPYVASERAVSYLKDLYAAYGDWSLAIAAYNCGPGTVNKAIRRAGGEAKDHDYWSIYNYLPAETRGYVPMFIAANYVMEYYPKHNISPVLPVKPLVIDTLQIAERIHFNQISKVLDIPVDELRILNPQFRADVIPGTPDSPYTLILPSQQVHAYLL